MKIKDIANQYGLDKDLFENFLENTNHRNKIKRSISGASLEDGVNMGEIVAEFKQYKAEKLAEQNRLAMAEQAKRAAIAKAEEAKRAAIAKAAADKKTALANMLITSGFNFDGFTITKYSGYISGDDAISVDRGMVIFGQGVNIKDRLLGSLVEIRRNALAELKEAAYALGCNAVIGVDFDYLTLDPQTANLSGGTTYQPYVFAVTANGNAVIIEKNE